MKHTTTIKNSNSHTRTRDLRDFVRFITVVIFIPWFGWITSNVFGFEAEFETELAVLLTFVIFGTFWCGWICPFGNLSYFISMIGKKLFPKIQIKIPEKIDHKLRYLKYLFLGIFIYVIVSNRLDYFFGDHMEMYFSTQFTTAFIKFKKFAILLVPLLIPRFFCKYLCFQKAAYNIINKVFPFTVISRDTDKCVQCKKCDKSCPMDIQISQIENVRGKDCIGCWSCLDENTCPSKANALSLKFFGRKVSPIYFAAAAIPIYYFITWMFITLYSKF